MDISQLYDDTLFHVLNFLTPFDFFSFCQTCLRFHHLNDYVKYSQTDKYWHKQCETLWTLMKKNDYKHLNYNRLFESIIDFIVGVSTKTIKNPDQNVTRNLRKQGYNLKITVDTIFSNNMVFDELDINMLVIIIEHDNLEMFKIYTCKMSDQDMNKCYKGWPTRYVSLKGYPLSILMVVIKCGALEIAKYLLSGKADSDNINIKIANNSVKKKNNHNNYNFNFNFPNIDIDTREESMFEDTPLTLAAYYKRVEIVSLLINHPNMTQELINYGDYIGQTPLHCACSKSNFNDDATFDDAADMVKILIDDKRTNINQCNQRGQTALIDAIHEQTKAAHILIDHPDFDVNIQCNKGQTALHYAAKINKYINPDVSQEEAAEMVRKLLQRKDIDKNIKDRTGRTALDFAKQNNFSQMILLLDDDHDDTSSRN